MLVLRAAIMLEEIGILLAKWKTYCVMQKEERARKEMDCKSIIII